MVNSKDGDSCSRSGAAEYKRAAVRPADQEADRPAHRAAGAHPPVLGPPAPGRVQRVLLLQAAPRRLPREGGGLGTPVQTKVLRMVSSVVLPPLSCAAPCIPRPVQSSTL